MYACRITLCMYTGTYAVHVANNVLIYIYIYIYILGLHFLLSFTSLPLNVSAHTFYSNYTSTITVILSSSTYVVAS